jgi:hypothetical protein
MIGKAAGAIAISLLLSAPALARVASDSAVPAVSPQVPLDPIQADKIRYFDPATGQMIEQYWAALDEKTKRELMPNDEAFVQIKQKDAGGSLSILPLSVSYKKGNYNLLFRWQKYRADVCVASQPNAGRIRTGIGLEIVAEITSKKNGLNLTNLGALTAAAEREHISGSIAIKQIGLGSSSPTLATYMTNFSLNREGVTKALEAIAVAKAVLENLSNKVTPHYLAITEASPGSCTSNVPVKLSPRG